MGEGTQRQGGRRPLHPPRQGRKVHINGIGEHRGRPLIAWRDSAVARAEARAPRELPPDERHRIAEIIEGERKRLQRELQDAPKAVEAARAEAGRAHGDILARLTADHREAAERAAERRAEFDAMAEQLLALQTQLSSHIHRYGYAGRRGRRAQTRALRALPDPSPLPGIPSPRTPSDPAPSVIGAARPRVTLAKAGESPQPQPQRQPGLRAGLAWLLPILYFGLTTVVGVGELGDNTAHLWVRFASRIFALAATVELLRLWIPRRRRRTAGPMPKGSGFQTAGVFLALTAVGMFEDEKSDVFTAACVFSGLAVLLLLAGTGLRLPRTTHPHPH